MTRAARALASALTLALVLSTAGCKDPTLVVGELEGDVDPEGDTDLPDGTVVGATDGEPPDQSALADSGQADAGQPRMNVTDDAGREGGATREPRGDFPIPKMCRKCPQIRDGMGELCPPLRRTFEYADCLECGCCESDQTCTERDPNFFCAGRDVSRETVGVCWPKRGVISGFPQPNP